MSSTYAVQNEKKPKLSQISSKVKTKTRTKNKVKALAQAKVGGAN